MRFDVTVQQYAVADSDDPTGETSSLTLFAADLDTLVQKLDTLFGIVDDTDTVGGAYIILFRSPDDELATEVRIQF